MMFYKAPSTCYIYQLYSHPPSTSEILFSPCTKSWPGVAMFDSSGRMPWRRCEKL